MARLGDYALIAFLVMVCVAQCAVVALSFKWLILEPSDDTEIACPMCEHSALTATELNMPTDHQE